MEQSDRICLRLPGASDGTLITFDPALAKQLLAKRSPTPGIEVYKQTIPLLHCICTIQKRDKTFLNLVPLAYSPVAGAGAAAVLAKAVGRVAAFGRCAKWDGGGEYWREYFVAG